MIASQKPLLLVDDSKLQLSVYPLRQANLFPPERSFASVFPNNSPTDSSIKDVKEYGGELAGTEVDAKLAHSL